MQILNRYFAKSFLGSFIGFGVVLVGLAWMVQILLLMKLIVKYGVDVGGFLSMSMYTIPLLISIIIPFILFIAAIFVYSKFIDNNEITVAMASGRSPYNIARPAIIVGAIIMVIHFALNLFLVPKSQDLFYKSQWDLRYGLGHLKLKESAFSQLTEGVVIYVGKAQQKDLMNVLIRDGRNKSEEKYITSDTGKLVNTDKGLSIVMGHGGLQVSGENGNIIGTFDSIQMDLGMGSEQTDGSVRSSSLTTSSLIKTLDSLESFSEKSKLKIISNSATRFLSPMLDLIFIFIAMLALLKTNILRRRGSKSFAIAILGMIVVEAMFMTSMSSISSVSGLIYLGLSMFALIFGLSWRLSK